MVLKRAYIQVLVVTPGAELSSLQKHCELLQRYTRAFLHQTNAAKLAIDFWKRYDDFRERFSSPC
jgi:hypothetical protein